MANGTLDPYAYMRSFSDPYSTASTYEDLGYKPTEEFLTTKDPATGLTYEELIPGYDPYAEELLRTQFQQGAREGYASSVSDLAGITSQARMRTGQTGFAGSGAIQSQVGQMREDVQSQYGSAFQGALLDLSSGIVGERRSYQESLAELLARFQDQTPQNILQQLNPQEEDDVFISLETSSVPNSYQGMNVDVNGTIFTWNSDTGSYEIRT